MMNAYDRKPFLGILHTAMVIGCIFVCLDSRAAHAKNSRLVAQLVDGAFAGIDVEKELSDPHTIPDLESFNAQAGIHPRVDVTANEIKALSPKAVSLTEMIAAETVSAVNLFRVARREAPIGPTVVAAVSPSEPASKAVSEPAIQSAENEGILIAVEKKSSTGKVSRQEAVLVLEDDHQPTEHKPTGIAVSLGFDRPVIQVLVSSVGLSVQPNKITLPHRGASVEVRVDDFSGVGASVNVYTRNPGLLNWDGENNILTATTSNTETEVFIARDGQLVVVPVTIGKPLSPTTIASHKRNDQMVFPAELAKLPVSADPGHGKFGAHTFDDASSVESSAVSPANSGQVPPTNSSDQMYVNMAALDVDGLKMQRRAQFADRVSLKLELVDDRTPASGSTARYPVAGAQIYAAGTEFSTLSDGHGRANVSDIPRGSSMVVVTDDPDGVYVKTASIVDLDGVQSNRRGTVVQREMVVPRWSAFSAWTRMSGHVQDAALGSLCLDFHGAVARGIRTAIDVKSSGAIYLNATGVPDPVAAETQDGGRVCWFNVSPGPVNVSAWYGDQQIMAAEFPVMTGRHTHERVAVLTDPVGLHVQFGRELPAHEQLSGARQASSYSVDAHQEAVLVATTQTLFESAPGIWGVGSLTTSPGGSSVVYVDTADGEPAIHRAGTLGAASNVKVLPSLPRGFVQDLAVYANEVQDFSYGSVLFEFAALQGQTTGRLTARMVNEYGQQVAEPWIFTDLPVAKGIFFNVDPGVYTVILESKETGWLASKTVSVYPEAMSVVQAGSQLNQILSSPMSSSISAQAQN